MDTKGSALLSLPSGLTRGVEVQDANPPGRLQRRSPLITPDCVNPLINPL
jgi:hypothetical protein